MNRIKQHFNRYRTEGKKTLSVFVTAGFPSLESTPSLLTTLQESGADMIELGIPFSDPLADGPVIQESSEVALQNGTTLQKVFTILSPLKIRIPVLLMGYANTIYSYGLMNFFQSCKQSGVDGVIIPDVSLEEGAEFRRLAQENDIASVLMIAPTTSEERIRTIDSASTGFLYCVSITGVTGKAINNADEVEGYIRNVKKFTTVNPILVGFGISTPSDAKRMSRCSDGVIVGSRIITILEETEPKSRLDRLAAFTRSLRSALDA